MSAFTTFMQSDEILTLEQLKTFGPAEQKTIKRLIQTNVWFGAQKIFRSPSQPPLRPFHKRICDALVQPNPDLPIAEWSPIKERVILAFRGAGKSTIEAGHIVQIVLCAPNVRILLVGGSLPRAAATVDLVRRHFNSNEVIRFLFPEFCDVSVSGASFTSPARTDSTLRDETVSIASFRSITAGWHGEFLKLDDATNEQNQRTPEAVAKTIGSYDDLEPLIEPNCFVDFNGTRWASDDIPQSIKENAEASGTEIIWLEIPVFTVKTGQPNQAEIDARNAAHDLDLETDVIFTWEAKWNAQTLAAKYRKPNFDGQYLLKIPESIAPAPSIVPPTQTQLLSLVRIVKPISEQETFVLNGDLAEVGQGGSDDCALVAGIWNPSQRHLTVTRIILDKFRDEKTFLSEVSQLHGQCVLDSPNQIRFRIENVRDAHNLWEPKFQALKIPVEFQYPSVERDARIKRIGKLFEALYAGQVYISQRCSHWKDIVKQFCGFNPRHNQRKVDLLDSVAQLWEYCQTISNLVPATAADILRAGVAEFPSDTFDVHLSATEYQQSRLAAEESERAFGEYENQRLNPYGIGR